MASIFEDVADIYLRLNGFFTVKNFFQHPMFNPPAAETDIDILAIRLPHEREVTGRQPTPLPNDSKIVWSQLATLVVLAEAKGEPRPFNRKWFDDQEVIPYALRRVGFTDGRDEIDLVSKDLRKCGAAQSAGPLGTIEFRLVLFSDYAGETLPSALVISWKDVLAFLKRRFDLLATSPIKRGMGPLKDTLFGFLYIQRDKLSQDLLHRYEPATPPYKPVERRRQRPSGA